MILSVLMCQQGQVLLPEASISKWLLVLGTTRVEVRAFDPNGKDPFLACLPHPGAGMGGRPLMPVPAGSRKQLRAHCVLFSFLSRVGLGPLCSHFQCWETIPRVCVREDQSCYFYPVTCCAERWPAERRKRRRHKGGVTTARPLTLLSQAQVPFLKNIYLY